MRAAVLLSSLLGVAVLIGLYRGGLFDGESGEEGDIFIIDIVALGIEKGMMPEEVIAKVDEHIKHNDQHLYMSIEQLYHTPNSKRLTWEKIDGVME